MTAMTAPGLSGAGVAGGGERDEDGEEERRPGQGRGDGVLERPGAAGRRDRVAEQLPGCGGQGADQVPDVDGLVSPASSTS